MCGVMKRLWRAVDAVCAPFGLENMGHLIHRELLAQFVSAVHASLEANETNEQGKSELGNENGLVSVT